MSEVETVPQTSEKKEEQEKESMVNVERAFELLAQGKRNILCGEVPDAVNQFQEATKILADKYGETAKECGDAYLSYGKALLEMSRMESGVLGNALQGIDEEEESEESESKSEASDDKIEDAEKVTDDDTATEAESEELNTEEEGEEGDEKKEGEEGEEKKEEEEDVSNLQLAWEVLELAKKIYKEEDTKESKLKLAEAHLKLGEVALETEQYESSIGDFKECLTIQKEVLEPENRCLAETLYQLGLAQTFSLDYNDAISNFKQAAAVMQEKIKMLEKVIEEGEKEGKGKDIADFEDPVYKAHKEVKELQDILPDILAKVEDVTEEQKSAEATKDILKSAIGFGSAAAEADKAEALASGEGTSSKKDEPTHVITHLVRKKRKTDTDEEDLASEEPKKPKIENGAGDAPADKENGTNGTNGTTSPEKKEKEAAMDTTEDVKSKTVEDVKKATEEAQS